MDSIYGNQNFDENTITTITTIIAATGRVLMSVGLDTPSTSQLFSQL